MSQQLQIEKIIESYNEGASPYEIAEKFNTYPNKVRRALKKAGIKIRTGGEAQSVAFKSGRKEHPTKGKARGDSTKLKIGNKTKDYWANLDDDSYNKRIEIAKELWNAKTDEERAEMTKRANEGVRKAAVTGSKAETFLHKLINNYGYQAEQHRKNIIKNTDLEVDLYIPSLATAIEINGVSHYLPVWSEETLRKAQAADSKKAGLILENGMVFICIKYMARDLGLTTEEQFKNKVLPILDQIKSKFPPKNERFIEIEVD